MANGKAGAPKGNKNAVKENRIITDAMRRLVTQNPDKIREACETFLDRAIEGDLAVFREIMDRLEGKPVQAIEGTGDNGQFLITISVDDNSVL